MKGIDQSLRKPFYMTVVAFALLPFVMVGVIGNTYASIERMDRSVAIIARPAAVVLILLLVSMVLEMNLFAVATLTRRIGLCILILLQGTTAAFAAFILYLSVSR